MKYFFFNDWRLSDPRKTFYILKVKCYIFKKYGGLKTTLFQRNIAQLNMVLACILTQIFSLVWEIKLTYNI